MLPVGVGSDGYFLLRLLSDIPIILLVWRSFQRIHHFDPSTVLIYSM